MKPYKPSRAMKRAVKLYQSNGGIVSRAARDAGVSTRGLHYALYRFGIPRPAPGQNKGGKPRGWLSKKMRRAIKIYKSNGGWIAPAAREAGVRTHSLQKALDIQGIKRRYSDLDADSARRAGGREAMLEPMLKQKAVAGGHVGAAVRWGKVGAGI